MLRVIQTIVFCTICGVLATVASAQHDQIEYVKQPQYPIFKEMEARSDSVKTLRDSITAEIRQRQEELKNKEDEEDKILLLDFAGVEIPASPEVFTDHFHFAPVAQYMTGTCWSFSGASFLESEAARLTGRQIKLSEMYTVYYEWVEKARRFVAERGDSRLTSGGLTSSVLQIAGKYGAVPLEAYSGLPDTAYERHDHGPLSHEIRGYLDFVKNKEIWDEEHVIGMVKSILDKHLGRPPETFLYDGKTYTPPEFLRDILQFNPDDYVTLMSTMAAPFYTQAEFKVYDNWRHDSNFYNVPLDVWYNTFKKAVTGEYTATIGGDVSEPGCNGFVDAAIIADYDIPCKYIDQRSREFRIYNETTTDDHGIHVVGYKKVGGRDWFLIKDSSSRGRYGAYPGYMFYRDDYIRMKMLTYTVHRDAIQEIADKFKP